MTWAAAYVLTCDSCGSPRVYHHSILPQDAFTEAQTLGWTIDGPQAICPDCPPLRPRGSR